MKLGAPWGHVLHECSLLLIFLMIICIIVTSEQKLKKSRKYPQKKAIVNIYQFHLDALCRCDVPAAVELATPRRLQISHSPLRVTSHMLDLIPPPACSKIFRMPYNIHGVVGKRKGKFIKQKKKEKIGILLTTIAGKQGRRISSSETEVSLKLFLFNIK